jgi:hypothetical protein
VKGQEGALILKEARDPVSLFTHAAIYLSLFIRQRNLSLLDKKGGGKKLSIEYNFLVLKLRCPQTQIRIKMC